MALTVVVVVRAGAVVGVSVDPVTGAVEVVGEEPPAHDASEAPTSKTANSDVVNRINSLELESAE